MAPPTVYLLLGHPGTGKYTVAQALTAVLSETQDVRLLDNHLLANTIFAVLPRVNGRAILTPEVLAHLDVMKAAWIAAIRDLCPQDASLIFTNHLLDTDVSHAWLATLRDLAAHRGSRFVPVVLTCEADELLRRVPGADREARLKLTDPARVQQLLDDDRLFRPAGALHLDVTACPPADAAAAIADHASA